MINREWEACSCETCQDMCRRRPCWPLPNEARKLIEMGYAKRLMFDWWGTSLEEEDIAIISPAIVGREGQQAPFFPYGRCTFLTDEGLCELHDSGAKPAEGRLALCTQSVDDGASLHEEVALAWDSDEGRDVIRLWGKEK